MPEHRRFVIGDIHGCLETFRAMVEEILRLEKNDALFLLGDYIDRGPDPKGVIDYIIDLQKHAYPIHPIMGNHEFMLIKSLEEPRYFDLWQMNGCTSTLSSFGIKEEELSERESAFQIPENYIRFFTELPYFKETEGYFIVHAGVPPGITNPEQDPETILWTRAETYNEDILKGRIMVHGHTPVPEHDIRKRVTDPRARVYNLDAGCVYSFHPGLGNLAALDLDSHKLYFLRNRDK